MKLSTSLGMQLWILAEHELITLGGSGPMNQRLVKSSYKVL